MDAAPFGDDRAQEIRTVVVKPLIDRLHGLRFQRIARDLERLDKALSKPGALVGKSVHTFLNSMAHDG